MLFNRRFASFRYLLLEEENIDELRARYFPENQIDVRYFLSVLVAKLRHAENGGVDATNSPVLNIHCNEKLIPNSSESMIEI